MYKTNALFNLKASILLLVTMFASSQFDNYLQAQEFSHMQDPIYVVDVQRIFTESIAGKAASNNLQEDAKKKRVVLEKKKLELDGLKNEIEKQASLLSASALESKQEQLMKKSRDFERSLQDLKEEMTIKNQESMQKILTKINATIKELAEKNNYKIILEKDLRVVIYANNQFDVSEEVIKLLNEKHVGL